jgi:putative lipoic acid-binding regulatory protein
MSELKLLKFPCRYPIKVMVRADPGLRAQLDAIVVRHAGAVAAGDISERPSAREKYLGITYFIEARDEAQIAALFAELKDTPGVLMVL